MKETVNMLYRLFAPMFVVVLIIGGVGLSSELVKNSQEKQTAITVTYAAGCPAGAIPITGSTCTARTLWGKVVPAPCTAVVPGVGVIPGVCTEYKGIGCCMATGLGPSVDSILEKTLIEGAIDMAIDLIGGIGGDLGDYDDGTKAPVCTTLTKTPSLPLRPGESATLSWVLSGGLAEITVVSPSIGVVQGMSVRVSPVVSTTYTVLVRNRAGDSECPKVRVHVGPRDNDEDQTDYDTNPDDYNLDIWGDDDNVQDDNTDTTSAYNDLYDDYGLGDIDEDIIIYDPGETQSSDDDTFYDPNYNNDVTNNVDTEQAYDADYTITKDDWYDYNDASLYTDAYTVTAPINKPNTSGLTDQEIYGVWNRPQNPTTGGLGLSGGYVGDNTEVGVSGGESPGAFSRVGTWFKNIFCFWCNNSAQTGDVNLASSVVSIEHNIDGDADNVTSCTTGNQGAALTINPREIRKEECSKNMTDIECRESWAGKKIKVKWSVPCESTCSLTGPDGTVRPNLNGNGELTGILIRTSEFILSCKDGFDNESKNSTTVRVIK